MASAFTQKITETKRANTKPKHQITERSKRNAHFTKTQQRYLNKQTENTAKTKTLGAKSPTKAHHPKKSKETGESTEVLDFIRDRKHHKNAMASTFTQSITRTTRPVAQSIKDVLRYRTVLQLIRNSCRIRPRRVAKLC